MNDSIAVSVRGLSKRYHIGALENTRRTLGETLTDALFAPFRRAGKLLRGHASGAAELDEELWALSDVSFEVPRGQVLGIIGRNGAGKSTLLKVLSRITEPTRGVVELEGRVGSLLEVGTGFHPELTGRENVFLNGAILGMRRVEIERKFDEIVAFAGVERFLDTPVKHYSSGMYVRLAFAVAAHLEPEILVIDEVLSVGDAEFQRRCLGKMEDVANSGRTVLFVSHNMSAVTDLCDRALLIHEGEIIDDGPPAVIVGRYLSMGIERTSRWKRPEDAESGTDVELESVAVVAGGEEASVVAFDQPLELAVAYEIRKPVRGLVMLFAVRNDQGTHLWTSWDTDTTDLGGRMREPGRYHARCRIPAGLHRPGRYYVSAVAQIPDVRIIEAWEDVIALDVSGVGYPFNVKRLGVITPRFEWEVDRRDGALAPSGDRFSDGDV